MADKWKTAFKTIHGQTPTKADYSLAPKHVQVELGSNNPPEKAAIKRNMKRPRLVVHAQYTSPLKKKSKKDPQSESINLQSLENQRLLEKISKSMNDNIAPKKIASKKFLLSTIESPSKGILSPLKPLLNHSPRKSIFTPERPSASNFNNTSITRTPIRSPRKPVFRKLVLQNTENLLLASNEKILQEPVDVDPFDDETSELPTELVNQKPKAKKNLFRYNTTRESAKSNGENFVKINMRKKNFVRGKLSAEAKRKLVRKQKWKAKFGGKKF